MLTAIFYLIVNYFGFCRNWWILFITFQRCIAVAFPLHSKIILTKRVLTISAITIICVSFVMTILRFLFEVSSYAQLNEFKMFHEYRYLFLKILLLVRSTIPTFGIFLFSFIVIFIINCRRLKQSTQKHSHKKVTKMIVTLAMVFFYFRNSKFYYCATWIIILG